MGVGYFPELDTIGSDPLYDDEKYMSVVESSDFIFF